MTHSHRGAPRPEGSDVEMLLLWLLLGLVAMAVVLAYLICQ